MIRVEGAGKRFGDRVAVETVSFEVAPGEVFGLLGPNGGGKTTTMRMIAGLIRPDSGTATVGGRDLFAEPESRHLLGFLTEQPGLYERLTVVENLAYFARLYDLPESRISERCDAALALFGLTDRAADRAGGLSKGLRQRLALARCVLHEPKALLLDEPTSGLDPEAAADVRNTIGKLAEGGLAIVVSTHNLAEAERICRRVAIVKQRQLALVEDVHAASGRVRIVADGLTDDVRAKVSQIENVRECRLIEGCLALDCVPGSDAVPSVVALIVSVGARVREVSAPRRALEARYLELVGASSAVDEAGSVG